MHIKVLVWDPRNLGHIARHGIQKEEVDEVAESRHEIRKVWRGRYAMRGQTYPGRYLIVFLDSLGQGRAYPVTARDMTEAEKSAFKRSR